mmetsp:Transcript_4320/g.13051  ORF Transcript_4320/g.13051 Transcript_4320/m.13051 type:complete len:202 (-) Transcript_4320:20-625(-)
MKTFVSLVVILFSLVAFVASSDAAIGTEWSVRCGQMKTSMHALVRQGQLHEDNSSPVDDIMAKLGGAGRSIIAIEELDGENAVLRIMTKGRSLEVGTFELLVSQLEPKAELRKLRVAKRALNVLWWFGYYQEVNVHSIDIPKETHCVRVEVLSNEVLDHLQFVSGDALSSEKVAANIGTKVEICKQDSAVLQSDAVDVQLK